ncbi:MAG: hypothetical protein IKQ91_05110 [Oscillospiraceae bacterium]|nr:hypothetical protein [Oscillospiraceae bacterium]
MNGLLLAEAEERVNITPVLLRFIGKFFLIFAAVAVIALLTPWLAKKIDAFREKHTKPAAPEDPRCKAVRGPYDMPEQKAAAKKAAPPQEPEQPAKKPYQPKH